MEETFPIIKNKLYRPPPQPDYVPRLRLLEQFEGWQQRPLTLISAPAGYGKTTLVTGWLETMDLPKVWVSLDGRDDDLVRFLNYFLAATRSIFPHTMEDTLALLNAPEKPTIQALTDSLINDLDQITAGYVLVLDNYHAIQQMDIHDLLSALLLNPPSSMHLVLVTRNDPPLDLINLRAQNRVIEIRARELRFNQVETKQYINRLLNRPVDSETAAILTEKSQGCVTAIRSLALSPNSMEKAG
jgi:LuxR family maltose regulon positive regulatory protein